MDNIEFLLQQRGKLLDRDGGWLAGTGVFSHGHDLLREMLPNYRYFHVLVAQEIGTTMWPSQQPKRIAQLG